MHVETEIMLRRGIKQLKLGESVVWRLRPGLRPAMVSQDPGMNSCRCLSASFSDCGVLPAIAERLKQQELVHPTDIQQRCLQVALEGSHAVVNSETGSGKTLCFLLPILQRLTKLSLERAKIPAPHSVVLVPTPDLANQINGVFKTLAEPEWGSSVVYKGSRLVLKPNSHLIIGTPSCIVQYNIQRMFRYMRLMCIDEADALLTGSEKKATWEILEIVRKLRQRDIQKKDYTSGMNNASSNFTAEDNESNVGDSGAKLPFCQMIFTAATMPAGGRMTVQSRLKRWLPKNTLFVTTEQTHQTINSAETLFIDISNQPNTGSHSPAMKFPHLLRDLLKLEEEELAKEEMPPKVLVFTNTVPHAEAVYSFLLDRLRGMMKSKNAGDDVPPLQSSPWWKERVGQFHSKLDPEQRAETLRRFRTGELCVLICTDLASRGLDLPEVAAVIQFDFPVNAADFLHRAGRTARAGRSGKVISYVGESDQDLAKEIKRILGDRSKTFETIFSRNKMLRRKIKARKARETILQEKES